MRSHIISRMFSRAYFYRAGHQGRHSPGQRTGQRASGAASVRSMALAAPDPPCRRRFPGALQSGGLWRLCGRAKPCAAHHGHGEDRLGPGRGDLSEAHFAYRLQQGRPGSGCGAYPQSGRAGAAGCPRRFSRSAPVTGLKSGAAPAGPCLARPLKPRALSFPLFSWSEP